MDVAIANLKFVKMSAIKHKPTFCMISFPDVCQKRQPVSSLKSPCPTYRVTWGKSLVDILNCLR
eukprot:2898109-Amphidinium_carterae.1